MLENIMKLKYIEGTSIELINKTQFETPPKCIIFDFDGTLSLIREGWSDIMIPMFVNILIRTKTHETEEMLFSKVSDFVMELNGRQTIYQMIRLVKEILKRNGHPKSPLHYKNIYHGLLMKKISMRRKDLKMGRISHHDMLVPGSLNILKELYKLDVILYLVSGTDKKYVLEEARLLNIEKYFNGNIHGAQDDYKSFSKELLIKNILQNEKISPKELLVFGDGYVEIENIHKIGGSAIAVASDERYRSGEPDLIKRKRLVSVGADMVIPDYKEAESLLSYLWRKN